ncbi:ATP-binding protein [Virgisporangium ochraceum]|uniref:Transcriptional regulator n=1 Tax=Virgisporangium ochraceum TaxID=65505 RepID=A0A8J4EJD7_9ACTN|nr:transcriptional regulator [Virgisporangium ochraceum]
MIAVKTREPSHTRFTVEAEADVAAVRRMVSDLIDDVSPDQDRHGRAELVVTELATNLVRHAGGGWMLVRPLRPSSIELIAVDGGRGIDDLDGVLAGRVSDPKGLGCGLRSVRRSSARFDAWTRPGGGTVVLSVLDLAGASGPPACAGVSVGIVEPCGDGWAYSDEDGVFTLAVVDGLGHGMKASLAADAALAEFGTDLEQFVPRANARMRDTRGAAVTLCQIADGTLRYIAIGNVYGRVVTPEGSRGLVTHGGTLGLHLEPPRSRISALPFPAGASLVLWTDGLSSRVSPDPRLLTHDPAVVAAALHRDHTRNRDDATVVVATPGGTR